MFQNIFKCFLDSNGVVFQAADGEITVDAQESSDTVSRMTMIDAQSVLLLTSANRAYVILLLQHFYVLPIGHPISFQKIGNLRLFSSVGHSLCVHFAFVLRAAGESLASFRSHIRAMFRVSQVNVFSKRTRLVIGHLVFFLTLIATWACNGVAVREPSPLKSKNRLDCFAMTASLECGRTITKLGRFKGWKFAWYSKNGHGLVPLSGRLCSGSFGANTSLEPSFILPQGAVA